MLLLALSLGPFAGFIIAAYSITAVVIVSLIAWLVFDGRRQAQTLAALESRGIRRRSD